MVDEGLPWPLTTTWAREPAPAPPVSGMRLGVVLLLSYCAAKTDPAVLVVRPVRAAFPAALGSGHLVPWVARVSTGLAPAGSLR